ncbi:hypothetical protein ABEU20_002496 [Rhodococcus sp. PAM 2766]|uniref:Lipoprotein n=1 Tax=Rhodococcus parequi TaxID=3137122 RepID=A0ABW9FGX3_9NOCA
MKRVACLAIALAAALSLTACTRETPVENVPDLLWAESFRWESTPGTDLDSPAAQLVRATVESDEITLTLGRRYTYPGYIDAAGEHGTTRTKGPQGGIGTLTMKLVELEQEPDAIDALVCLDTTQVSTLVDGKYVLPKQSPFYVLHAYRVSARLFTQSTEQPGSASPRQNLVPRETHPLSGPSGRSARPTADVFGDWMITEFAMSAAPESRAPCLEWAEQRWGSPNPPAPTRTESEPPVIEPFYPGW